MANHAPARTHIISNQPASPIALAKSTAIGPKAMRYRNGFMRIVISVRPQTSSTSPISAKRPMLGSKKAPSLVGGAKDYKRHSRKPNTCFRSRAIPGARIGSRKKSPAEAGPSVLRKEGYFRSSAAKQFRGRGLVPTAASARHKSHRVLPQNNRCPLLPALSRQARSAHKEAEVNATWQLVSGMRRTGADRLWQWRLPLG